MKWEYCFHSIMNICKLIVAMCFVLFHDLGLHCSLPSNPDKAYGKLCPSNCLDNNTAYDTLRAACTRCKEISWECGVIQRNLYDEKYYLRRRKDKFMYHPDDSHSSTFFVYIYCHNCGSNCKYLFSAFSSLSAIAVN